MLKETFVAVFTQNLKLYEKLATVLKEIGIQVAQFAYGERLNALDHWVGDGSLIVLLDANQQPDQCLRWIEQFSENRKNTVSVWMERELNQQHSIKAIRAGARDLLIGEFNADEVRSLVKRVADVFIESRVASTVLGVMGSAGGCGVSTLVANLAVDIATIEAVPVGVLDLNPCVSGVGLLLNLSPDFTLFDLWERIEELDLTLVKRAASEHPSGVSLVSSEKWPPEYLPISEKVVRQVVLRMQQLFPYILVDLPMGLYPATRVVLEAAEALLLVTPYSMMGATGAAHLMDALKSIDYPPRRILWVANSVSEPAGLKLSQIRHVLSSKPAACIPFAPEPVNRAAGDGTCLAEPAPRAAVTKSIRKLAETLCQSFRQHEVDNRGTRVPSA